MLEAAEYDYEIESGFDNDDCLPLHVALLDENDDPLVLTGYSSEFVVIVNNRVVIRLRSADDTLDINDSDSPNTGEITGELNGEQIHSLPLGKIAQYKWSVTEPSGCKITFLKGFIVRH